MFDDVSRQKKVFPTVLGDSNANTKSKTRVRDSASNDRETLARSRDTFSDVIMISSELQKCNNHAAHVHVPRRRNTKCSVLSFFTCKHKTVSTKDNKNKRPKTKKLNTVANLVVAQCSVVFELFAVENNALLVRGDTLFVLHLSLLGNKQCEMRETDNREREDRGPVV